MHYAVLGYAVSDTRYDVDNRVLEKNSAASLLHYTQLTWAGYLDYNLGEDSSWTIGVIIGSSHVHEKSAHLLAFIMFQKYFYRVRGGANWFLQTDN